MRAHALVAAAAVVALTGCGGSDETTASKPAATAQKSAPTPASASDEQAAADVALRYAHAIADEDWAAVCATRTEAERKSFARDAGSCPRAFELILKDKATEAFAAVKAGDVRIRGNVAGIDLLQPGQTEPVTTLGAVKQHGEWLLQDMKESKIP
jgi:hypothetical protein